MWQQRRHQGSSAFEILSCEVMEQWQHSGPHSTAVLGRAERSSSLPSLGAELPRSLSRPADTLAYSKDNVFFLFS